MQEEQADKVRLVDVYNARLTAREQRRAFIRDRGLLNVKRMQVIACNLLIWCNLKTSRLIPSVY